MRFDSELTPYGRGDDLSLTLKPRWAVRAKISSRWEPMFRRGSDQCRSRKDGGDQRPVDRGAHGHPRAPRRRQGRGHQRSVRSRRRRSAWPRAASSASEVEVIIVATVTPDMMFPVDGLPGAGQARREGRVGIRSFGGCSGFPYALQVGAKLVESGAHKKVLVIGADVMSSHHRLHRPRDLRPLRRRRAARCCLSRRKRARSA